MRAEGDIRVRVEISAKLELCAHTHTQKLELCSDTHTRAFYLHGCVGYKAPPVLFIYSIPFERQEDPKLFYTRTTSLSRDAYSPLVLPAPLFLAGGPPRQGASDGGGDGAAVSPLCRHPQRARATVAHEHARGGRLRGAVHSRGEHARRHDSELLRACLIPSTLAEPTASCPLRRYTDVCHRPFPRAPCRRSTRIMLEA